ncbi:TetR/AcrR family transcriptional regulator, partial [Klebsiella pneumoniae]
MPLLEGFPRFPVPERVKNPPEGDRRSARRGQLAEPYVRYSLLMSSARNGGRPSGRTSMIEAAERVARRDGPGAVTVEAVIREAGVSRGGLMYHFPSKLDLIRALVEQDV